MVYGVMRHHTLFEAEKEANGLWLDLLILFGRDLAPLARRAQMRSRHLFGRGQSEPGMFSTKRLQQAADALEDARVRYAHAMANPKDTDELNAAQAEIAHLEQQVGALTSPGGPRAYGSGSPDPKGYRDLGQLGRGVNDPTYTGPGGYDPSGGHKYQKQESHYPEGQHPTGNRAEPSWAKDQLPAHDYSDGGRRRR
jgi:hypothetical protein